MDWYRSITSYRTIPLGLIVILVLGIALGLRLYGIGWDGGYGFHPDERSIYMQSDCMYQVLNNDPNHYHCIREHPATEPGIPGITTILDAEKSPLNPHWFPLGSILIYALVALRFLIEPFTDLDSLQRMSYLGRSLSALADVGTVYLVYKIGRRIFNTQTGVLASILIAFSVIHIQIAHFYRPEPFQTFFLLMAFWYMLRIIQQRRLINSLILGLFVGLAIAPKISVLPLVFPLATAHLFCLFTTVSGNWRKPSAQNVKHLLIHGGLTLGISAATLIFTMPYALLDHEEFLRHIRQQIDMASTAGSLPFTVQYVATTSYVYEITQSTIWGMGIPLGITAWGGLAFTILYVLHGTIQKRHIARGQILILALVLPNFVMLGLFEVKFLRYLIHLIPFLVLMGSSMLVWILHKSRDLPSESIQPHRLLYRIIAKIRPYGYKMVLGTILMVGSSTIFYALAFETIYSRPHSAIQASEWINDNVPRGSDIVLDNHWDEGIPELYRYKTHQIPIYDPDNLEKMRTIADILSFGDYLVFYSNRTYGSISRLPYRYPLSSRYYRLLFDGSLGYEPFKAFTSYPELSGVRFVDNTFDRAGIPEPAAFKPDPSGITLNLGYADENVMDYDHPKVLIFQKTDELDPPEILRRLLKGLSSRDDEVGLMLNEEQLVSQRGGGTWSTIFDRGGWVNKVPIIAWLLIIELIYVAGLPFSIYIFRSLPDKGVILARPLGILIVSYCTWLLASLGWMEFSKLSIIVSGTILSMFSIAVLMTSRWEEVARSAKKIRGLIGIGEIIFLTTFLAFVFIRWANPDLWHPFRGGEKPMDFAYLNAIVKSTYMPPYDPWFSGGYLNYYYWGQFVIAMLIKASGILPSIAYNLAVPLMFSLTITTAYSVVYNMAASLSRPVLGTLNSTRAGTSDINRDPDLFDPNIKGNPITSTLTLLPRKAITPVTAGILAGLFTVAIGNLDGMFQFMQSFWHVIFDGQPFQAFDYWRSSRMIAPIPEVGQSLLRFWIQSVDIANPAIGYHITEFPFFTFLFADLHAHMIAIPFGLLAIGLIINLTLGIMGSPKLLWTLSATISLSIALGALWAINSWDYPTYIMVTIAMLGVTLFVKYRNNKKTVIYFALGSTTIIGLSILAYLPFHNSYHPYPTGLDVSTWNTPIINFVSIHGLFMFLVLTLILLESRKYIQLITQFVVNRIFQTKTVNRNDVLITNMACWQLAVPGVVCLAAIYLVFCGYWTASLLSFLLAFTILPIIDILNRPNVSNPARVFPLILVCIALIMAFVVEFVRIQDDIGRMNTLFKYYIQVWVLLAIVSGYAIWHISKIEIAYTRALSIARWLWIITLIALMSSSLIYTFLGTHVRINDRFGSDYTGLDGSAFMETSIHVNKNTPIHLKSDLQAINWLNDNVEGSPVILEAHTDQYNWGGRVSSYTGLPTILGWPWHQTQQRMKYRKSVSKRSREITEIYSVIDKKRTIELLANYDVKYIIVGDLERSLYPQRGLDKFNNMLADGIVDLVYENSGTMIYRVLWYN